MLVLAFMLILPFSIASYSVLPTYILMVYNTLTSPPRADKSFFSAFHQQPTADSREFLQRRFTTYSSKIPGAFSQI